MVTLFDEQLYKLIMSRVSTKNAKQKKTKIFVGICAKSN